MIATAISDTSYPVRFGGGVGTVVCDLVRRRAVSLGANDPEGVRQLESAGVEGR